MPSFTKLNRSAATLTKNRTEGSVSPFSGMCAGLANAGGARGRPGVPLLGKDTFDFVPINGRPRITARAIPRGQSGDDVSFF